MHFFADRLQAGPFTRTYMLGYEQMMRKKSIKSRKYRGHSPSKRQNILIFHQNPLQHPISSLSACHVIIYCDLSNLTSADPEGGTGGPHPPGKSQVIWVSIGNKRLDPPPLPRKKLDPPGKCWTPSGTLKNDRFL